MTSTGSTQAAAPKAAALLPFSSDAPASKQPKAADTFGKLLAATIGETKQANGDVKQAKSDTKQAKRTTDAAGDAQNTTAVADAWFNTLTIDFATLNAGLDKEEGADAGAIEVAPQDAAEDCEGEDDETNALETFGLPIVAALDVPLKPVLADAPVSGAPGEAVVGAAVLDAPIVADTKPADANVAVGDQHTDAPVTAVKANDAAVAQPAVTDVHDAAAQLDATPAESANTTQETSQPAHANAQSPVQSRAPQSATPHAIAQAEVQAAAQQTTAADNAAATVAESASTSTPQAAAAAAEGAQTQNAQPSPDMPRTGRARNAVAAKFAEMANLGQNTQASAAAAARAFADSSGTGSKDASAGNTFGGFLRQGAAVPAASNTTTVPAFAVNPQVNLQAVAGTGEVVATPATPGAVPDAENAGRLIDTMRVQVQQGVQEATVRLKPEHFGEVTISLKVERGAVSAVIHTDTPGVQEWLQSQEDKLRSGLADQGLHLERYQVQRDGSQARRDAQQQQQQQQTPRQRQARTNAPRFEISV